MLKLAIIGYGSRGELFGNLIEGDGNANLVAVADTEICNRKKACLKFSLPQDKCFKSAEDFFKAGKICDAVFICTQDAQHLAHAVAALNLGYDICLEKPAAATLEDCLAIRDLALKLGRKVMLTHVLRYAPFFQTIKKMIDEGKLGKVVTINQTENISYWHFGLSYVRGPWRDMKKSTPTIIAKCCHDLDIISWLMGKKCTNVSSFGKLFYFNKENAPIGSADYCVDCPMHIKEKCLYNAFVVYPERIKRSVVGGLSVVQGQDIQALLSDRNSIQGRCVFQSDNDAIDNQIVNMQFEDGSTAHLTMTAFSEQCYRYIKVHGTLGEVHGNVDESKLYYTPFGGEKQVLDLIQMPEYADKSLSGGHGGGDYYCYMDFIDYITKNSPSITRTSIDVSIESHIIGFLAEESRLNDGKVFNVKRKN